MALNYQTEDKQNFINRARFSDNGGCGYVLKPQFLRDYSISYSPNSPCGLDTNLYPGHFLAKILPLKNLHKVYDNTRTSEEMDRTLHTNFAKFKTT